MHLPPQLLQYTAMGFCCSLADVAPPSSTGPIKADWGDAAVDFLQELTQEKLAANIVRRSDPTKPIVVQLFRADGSGPSLNANVADEMIRRGIALRAPPSTPLPPHKSNRPQLPPQSPRAPQRQQPPQQQQRHSNNNNSAPRALTSSAHATSHAAEGIMSPRQQRHQQQNAASNHTPHQQQQQQHSKSFTELPPAAIGQVADVMIAWMKDPSEVYVQLVSQEEQLLEITRKLEEVYSQLETGKHGLETVAVGVSCVAKYAQDDSWYRAVVQEINGRQVLVKFIGKIFNVFEVEQRKQSPKVLSNLALNFFSFLNFCPFFPQMPLDKEVFGRISGNLFCSLVC